uniref:TIR domain-containing protein n=1 Tax=Candidatus Kentrum sp. FM TaxID=2126340 RepID=A0A450W4J7_9GAMM|nr:MAG: TIR domain-containing protein [Candidatus Kentron sp. FM]VFJ59002.1 MAG: TIR domain-containing protein [Candidatus Kentron sp. FM]VFK11939.1 MAG: TIR domain-containing protein [Candidatus Kentron sp. FM]
MSFEPIKLFYSYSHKDEGYRKRLETHLSVLKHQGIIGQWHDRKITAGTDWARQISENLESADIILLLVSADFLASEYCYDKETAHALKRHEEGSARVIPIILRPCDWRYGVPFNKLQALPKDAKPVSTWENDDEAFTNIARGIRKAAMQFQESMAASVPTTTTPSLPDPRERDTCFVLMQINEIFDEYYREVYAPAIIDAGFKPMRAQGLFGTGTVMEQIWEQIHKANVLIADISDRNPNVLYELGLVHAQYKPVVLTAGSMEDVPFDISHSRTFVYDVRKPGWSEKLKSYVTRQLLRVKENPSLFTLPMHDVANCATVVASNA